MHTYHGKQPFPTREVVARALDCSRYTIDAAISTRLAEGLIEIETTVAPGNVARREFSSVKERRFVPSQELLAVVVQAKKREARAARKQPAPNAE
ncbi:hypothetical protein [Mycobacterium sp.]|uniref:hypothetical protein n=1 Tax=Mycobacterium sp. TaxID=1785 RepID=UPI003F989BE5